MSQALIGYTGFVGGNLLQQAQFQDLYNSTNIETIANRKFDLIVCAGAPAVKWLANREPEQDWASINRLIEALTLVSCRQFILISTVDVYPVPTEVYEDSAIDVASLQPYGKHRFELEKFVQANFDCLIVRLPGLFGSGLKKNIIYDFMEQNSVDKIHRDSVFQFYYLDHLWRDIETSLNHSFKCVNFATEPTSVAEVAGESFGFEFSNQFSVPARYDMRTRYGDLFGSSINGYLYNKAQVLSEIKDFVTRSAV